MGTLKQTNITIQCFEYRDSYNFYFYGYLFIDGLKDLLIMQNQYGYGEQYLCEAKDVMIKAGLIPKGYKSPLWVFCSENGIKLNYSKKSVNRKEYKMQDKIFDVLAKEHDKGIDGINADRAKDTE